MSYRLFLDDIRQPHQAADYVLPVSIRGEYIRNEWAVVKNYDEFVAHIKEHGLPTHISFDHDLALEHYTPQEYWHDYNLSKEFQDAREYREKNGKDCAVWLCDQLAQANLPLPVCYVHSMNPVGADNIKSVLASYNRQFKK